MSTDAPVLPGEVQDSERQEDRGLDRPWLVIVWDDPVNLMTYVTLVFQRVLGYGRARAEQLMLEVHNSGRAVVSSGPLERAESDAFRLQQHGLWATLQRDEG